MNSARPLPGTTIARLEDIADPGAIVRAFQREESYFSLLLTRRGEEVRAFENRCAHAGFPRERYDGRVIVQERRYVVCSSHGASFTFDGECAGGPCNGDRLTPIAITIDKGAILMA